MVSLLIALNVEERVAVPEPELAWSTERDGGGLAVSDQHLPGGVFPLTRAGPAVLPILAGRTSSSLKIEILSQHWLRLACLSDTNREARSPIKPNVSFLSWQSVDSRQTIRSRNSLRARHPREAGFALKTSFSRHPRVSGGSSCSR